MIVDPNVALKAELVAALDLLEHQIAGLDDFLLGSIRPETAEAISSFRASRAVRARLIREDLEIIEAETRANAALDADGYPDLPNAKVAEDILKEIREQIADLELAASVFEAKPRASTLSVELGPATPKV